MCPLVNRAVPLVILSSACVVKLCWKILRKMEYGDFSQFLGIICYVPEPCEDFPGSNSGRDIPDLLMES